MENITNLDKLLINLEVVASFKNLNSKTELNENKVANWKISLQ